MNKTVRSALTTALLTAAVVAAVPLSVMGLPEVSPLPAPASPAPTSPASTTPDAGETTTGSASPRPFAPRESRELSGPTSVPVSAAVATTAVTPLENVRLIGRFVLWTGSTRTWVGVPGPTGAGDVARATAAKAKEDAARGAASWAFPGPGATGPILRGDLCLTVGAAGTPVTTTRCDGGPGQRLRYVEVTNGWAIASEASGASFIDFDAAGGRLIARDSRYADGVQLDLLAPVGQRDIDVTTVAKGPVGTATVTGEATPGASIVLDSPTGDADGPTAPVAEADGEGHWILEVTGIPARGTALRVEQRIGGTSYGSAEAVVSAWEPPPTPTAMWTFDDDVQKRGVASGTGVEGATIVLRHEGSEVGRALVSDGTWSTEVNSLGPGLQELMVTQSSEGLESATTTLAVDFGATVSITSPADGTEVQPVTEMEGRGEPGSLIEIRLRGSDTILSTTVVGPDGHWSAPAVDLG